MEVILSKEADKYLDRVGEPMRSRIERALHRLESEPPEGDIKKLQGQNSYRLKIGGYRAIFTIDDVIIVHKIAPRGQVYKGKK
jgi:mRNA interferase RelE/StbE